MNTWVWPFIILAAIGLIFSVIIHFFALLGVPNPFGEAVWGLHTGIFVVWIPAMLISFQLTKDFKQKDFWKAALRGCPAWMKYMSAVLFIYAIINFVISVVSISSKGSPGKADALRAFSGHWMAFYSAAMAILYSSTRVSRYDENKRCPNGHLVPPLAKYCEECGQPIVSDVVSQD